MNSKRILPIVLLIVMALLVFVLRRCENASPVKENERITRNTNAPAKRDVNKPENNSRFNRNVAELYFTKHAKCRMACRHVTQKEVREILAEGTINYNKSELDDPQGPTYALEGETSDKQHVRIIFAPKQKHMSVVTVIDLENDFKCNCN